MNDHENAHQAGVCLWQLVDSDEPEVSTPLGNSAEEVLHGFPRALIFSDFDLALLMLRDVDLALLMASTRRQDTLDLALRRSGRFDMKITVPRPDPKLRALI